MFFGSLQIDLCVKHVVSLDGSLELSLYDLTYSYRYSKYLVLTIEQYLVPQYGAKIKVEGAPEHRDDPFKQEHLAGGIVLLEVGVQEGTLLFAQSPKNLINLEYSCVICSITIIDKLKPW